MKRLELQNTNRPLEAIRHWHERGYLDLDPPYQRGLVWNETRQRNLILSLLKGIPVASIIINDRTKSELGRNLEEKFLAVIDGKQRMTAVLSFLSNGFKIPAEWLEGIPGPQVYFSELPLGRQRRFQNIPMAFSEASVGTIEEEQEVFELVNFGGVPQGESDLG